MTSSVCVCVGKLERGRAQNPSRDFFFIFNKEEVSTNHTGGAQQEAISGEERRGEGGEREEEVKAPPSKKGVKLTFKKKRGRETGKKTSER